MMRALTLLLSTQLLTMPVALSELIDERAADLSPILKPILEKSQLPSLAAALIDDGHIKAAGAVGVRKFGDQTPVTVGDKYHLGSCTKPMTATLAAILIEDGLLTWETTISEALKGKARIHRDFRDVTIEQLLAHVGGFSSHCPPSVWKKAFRNQGKIPATEQRMEFVKALLQEKPGYEPGTKTVYSNQGYAVVGVILESLSDQPWEQLMSERVFEPLGMTSAGFREPASAGKNDQPWGHRDGEPIAPGLGADNPDAIAPAGAVHASIVDWAKFARFHLEKEPGKLLKKAESFDRLNSTLKKSGLHGVGGWLVHNEERFGGHALQMTGSNTMWYALLWILPGRSKAFVVSTNAAPESAFATCEQVAAALMSYR